MSAVDFTYLRDGSGAPAAERQREGLATGLLSRDDQRTRRRVCSFAVLFFAGVGLIAYNRSPDSSANYRTSARLGSVPLFAEQRQKGDLLELVQTAPGDSVEGLGEKLRVVGYVPMVKEELLHGYSVSASGTEANTDTIIELSDELDQEITGFGGALTEAASLVYKNMKPSLQQEFLEKYYGADGLGYTVGRTHINSCDFSPNSWSFDDVPNDFDLKHFDHNVSHDHEAMLPLIKLVQQKVKEQGQEFKLFASPWSPPAWMKQSGQMDGSTRPGLREDCKLVWAKYIAAWISAYKAQGVALWGLTPQNEPENPAGWEACVYTAQEEADWVGAYLGPVMKETHPEVNIFAFDHNKDHVYEWAETFYNHPTAGSYIAGIAFHWYAGGDGDPEIGMANVEKVHKDFPQAVLLPSEATYERYRWTPGATVETGSRSMGEGYAHEIMGDLNAGSTGWVDWNLILDKNGGPNHVGNVCDAAMMVDLDKQELYLHPQYYFMAHFSKYIERGSRRMLTKVLNTKSYKGPPRPYGTCTGDDGLQATAFQLPDTKAWVMVVLNCGDEAIDFTIRYAGRATRTSIPAHSIQTYRGVVDL